MDLNTRQVLINIQRYGQIKKFLTILCYVTIFCGIMLYVFHGLSKQNSIKLINDFQSNKDDYFSEKIMTNPKIILQYNHNDIYNIKASKAMHKSNNEIILQDVFAEGNIGKITAGQLKISEDGNHLVFTINPVLILK
jgi:hypothetical protein